MSDGDRPPLPVLLGLTGTPYEEALLAVLSRPGARLRVVRRCLDLADLLAAASTGEAGVAVVSPDLHRLDREALARLAASGVVPYGVATAGDDTGAQLLVGLGVGLVVPALQRADGTYDGAALAAALAAATTAGPAAGQAMAAYEHGFSALPGPWGRAASPGHDDPGGAGEDLSRPPGRLVAVWGPVGAPGRTTVAVSLADELARLGSDVLLADADTYGPSVAQHLGVLDEASGLASAVRVAATGALDAAALSACARTVGRLRVLTGLTRPDRWPELRPASLSVVWRAARGLVDVTVVDTGFCLEDDEELAYDTAAPRRNGAALLTIESADVVVAVGSADPVGLARLVRGVHDLTERRSADGVRVVVTRVRRGSVGRRPARRVAEALDRLAGVVDPVLVPDDVAAFDAALAKGRVVAEVAPKSAARTALRGLAAELHAATTLVQERPS